MTWYQSFGEEFHPEPLDTTVFYFDQDTLTLSTVTSDVEKLGLYKLWYTVQFKEYLDSGPIWPNAGS